MTYSRDQLKDLGVYVPGAHTLDDYSESGTSVVIAAIEVALANRRGVGALPVATAELRNALTIERLAWCLLKQPSVELPCPSCGGFGKGSVDDEFEYDCPDCGGSGSYDPVAGQIEMSLIKMGAQ